MKFKQVREEMTDVAVSVEYVMRGYYWLTLTTWRMPVAVARLRSNLYWNRCSVSGWFTVISGVGIH